MQNCVCFWFQVTTVDIRWVGDAFDTALELHKLFNEGQSTNLSTPPRRKRVKVEDDIGAQEGATAVFPLNIGTYQHIKELSHNANNWCPLELHEGTACKAWTYVTVCCEQHMWLCATTCGQLLLWLVCEVCVVVSRDVLL